MTGSMSASWQLAHSSLAARKWRTALMTGAIALATALVVAVSCAIATVQGSIEHALVSFLGASDVRIVHPFNGRFDEAELEKARSWNGVGAATGRFGVQVNLIHADRRTDPETGEVRRVTPNAVGVEFDLVPRFRNIDVVKGELPGVDERDGIVIDQLTADQLDADVGDELLIETAGQPVPVHVAAIYRRVTLGVISRGLIETDLDLLQRASGFEDRLTSVYLILEDGVDIEAFIDEHKDDVHQAISLERADLARSGFDRQLRGTRLGLISGSVLTFMCAAFIIVTGLTTSVSERQREMAVTRCVGGTRGQLFGTQLFFGIILSGIGVIVGLPIGIGLAAALRWWYRAYLLTELRFTALGLGLAVGGALGAGLLGALYPALLASRVPPLRAMTSRARPASRKAIALTGVAGVVLIAVQVALFQHPDPTQRFQWYAYVGVPLVFIGAFLITVPLLVMVAMGLTRPLAAVLRLPPDMLRGSVLATPFRNGFTAGALMVGITVLVSTWSNDLSLMNHWLKRMEFADGVAFRVVGITEEQREAIEAMPFVERSCPLRYLPLRVFNQQVFGLENMGPRSVKCFSTDPEVFFEINPVQWVQGDPKDAIPRLTRGEGILVADRFTTAKGLGVGDVLTLGSGENRHDYEILGVIDVGWLEITAQLFGMRSTYMDIAISGVFMDGETVAERYGNADVHFLQLELSDEVGDAEARKEIMAAAPGILFWTSRDITDKVNEIAYTTMTIHSTVAFAALVLACIAAGNVLLANIRARLYEYGVLRAVGGMRFLLARLVFGEASLIAITAALAGTLLGMHLAWLGVENYREFAGLAVRLVFPVLPTVIGWAVLIALALLAAVPGVWAVLRPRPADLLAIGRNG